MQKSATACARLRSANAPDASWSLLDGTTPSSLLFARPLPREPQTSLPRQVSHVVLTQACELRSGKMRSPRPNDLLERLVHEPMCFLVLSCHRPL